MAMEMDFGGVLMGTGVTLVDEETGMVVGRGTGVGAVLLRLLLRLSDGKGASSVSLKIASAMGCIVFTIAVNSVKNSGSSHSSWIVLKF